MTEHYEKNGELIYSYGENGGGIIEAPSDYPEKVEDIETVAEEGRNPLLLAQEYLGNYPEETRMKADSVVSTQNEILGLLESPDPIKKQKAFYASFGSLLYSMPIDKKEREDMPLDKRILSGTILRGAQTATLAVAMMIPMFAGAKDKKPQKQEEYKEAPAPILSSEESAIRKIGDNIFGKDFLGIKEDRKEWYMQLERDKRDLYRQLDSESGMSPRSEEEKSMFKLIESKRDRQLAEIKIQEIKLSKESMKADLSDPEIVAQIEAKTAKLSEAKAKIIHDFEAEIRRAYVTRRGPDKNDFIKNRIKEIERNQNKLVRSEIHRTNSYYHSGWTY